MTHDRPGGMGPLRSRTGAVPLAFLALAAFLLLTEHAAHVPGALFYLLLLVVLLACPLLHRSLHGGPALHVATGDAPAVQTPERPER